MKWNEMKMADTSSNNWIEPVQITFKKLYNLTNELNQGEIKYESSPFVQIFMGKNTINKTPMIKKKESLL